MTIGKPGMGNLVEGLRRTFHCTQNTPQMYIRMWFHLCALAGDDEDRKKWMWLVLCRLYIGFVLI